LKFEHQIKFKTHRSYYVTGKTTDQVKSGGVSWKLQWCVNASTRLQSDGAWWLVDWLRLKLVHHVTDRTSSSKPTDSFILTHNNSAGLLWPDAALYNFCTDTSYVIEACYHKQKMQ